MAAVDDEVTTNGFEYDSETASLDEDDKKHIEDAIKTHIRSVVELRKEEFELPETVSLIECPDGSKVYLVGTAHFSKESIDDVVNVCAYAPNENC
ncbi:unnamed protein product [Echinostoma caproni]|uniref:TraB domain-containing protein n=1 Tax=Echinostoma caproni TaxID=27848 RepID=A0A183BEJ5_9TREM|nr:unnamed protein product [Echinostoma caproni]